MLKKISLLTIIAVTTSCIQNVNANTLSDNQLLQKQLDQVKKEINTFTSDKKSKDKLEYSDTSSMISPPPIGTLIDSSQSTLNLLQQHNIYDRYSALAFGGYIQITPQIWNGNAIKNNFNMSSQSFQSGKNISITTTNLYITYNLGNYINAETTLAANASDNYKINVQDASIIFGNLDTFPLYLTVGKNRLDLGLFSGGGPWTPSLAQMLFRPGRVNNMSLTYHKNSFTSNIAIFQTNDHESNILYSIFYDGNYNKVKYSVNGGYVYNINGIGNNSFNLLTNYEKDKVNVGALNFNANVDYDIYHASVGLAQTTHKLFMTNNSYAGSWYVQTGFSKNICNRPTTFNISYHGAYNTENLPTIFSTGNANQGYLTTSGTNKMTIASVQHLLFENFSLGFEYTYMHMYDKKHTNVYSVDISLYF